MSVLSCSDSPTSPMASCIASRSPRPGPEWPSACQPSGCDNLLHFRPAEQRHRALRNVANARPLPEAPQRQAEQAYRAALVGEAEQGTDQVDFPEPLPPIRATASPARTERLTPQHGKAAQFDREIVGCEDGTRRLGACPGLPERREVGVHDREVILPARLAGDALDRIQYVGSKTKITSNRLRDGRRNQRLVEDGGELVVSCLALHLGNPRWRGLRVRTETTDRDLGVR